MFIMFYIVSSQLSLTNDPSVQFNISCDTEYSYSVFCPSGESPAFTLMSSYLPSPCFWIGQIGCLFKRNSKPNLIGPNNHSPLSTELIGKLIERVDSVLLI